jgi:hypothetical protein
MLLYYGTTSTRLAFLRVGSPVAPTINSLNSGRLSSRCLTRWSCSAYVGRWDEYKNIRANICVWSLSSPPTVKDRAPSWLIVPPGYNLIYQWEELSSICSYVLFTKIYSFSCSYNFSVAWNYIANLRYIIFFCKVVFLEMYLLVVDIIYCYLTGSPSILELIWLVTLSTWVEAHYAYSFWENFGVYKLVHFVQKLHLFQRNNAVYFESRVPSWSTWA